MSGPEFFQTRMGQQFYDGTMVRLAKAAADIAEQLTVLNERLARVLELQTAANRGPHLASCLYLNGRWFCAADCPLHVIVDVDANKE